jgi:hypothetical protein
MHLLLNPATAMITILPHLYFCYADNGVVYIVIPRTALCEQHHVDKITPPN